MKIANLCSVAAAVLAASAGPAAAHHSANMFDSQKEVVLEGTIKEFQWTNPHTWIQVLVADPKGAAVEWSIEGGSPNLVGRQGWKRNSFKAGDKVVMKVHPLRNGDAGGSFVSATFSDGRTLGGAQGAPPATGPAAAAKPAY
ncbi:MAG TPA: DUF6152 family protein [Steroidobacteraceae bacterium]|jgi:hypothetical protein|nr:DUF6152 family protein [Steroidobacteraceae bacterium]